MANKQELILDLLARNKMGSETGSAARDLDKVGTAADAAARKTKGLGEASKGADRAAEDLGDSSSEAARKINKLDHEIKSVNQDLVLLAAQLADADDAAQRLDVSKGIRKSQADLKKLTSAKGILEGILPDPEPAGRSFMKRLGASISSAGDSVATQAGNHVGITIGAAMAAAAAPVLVSGIGAALSAGAGALGIGAGVALAVSRDKDIQAAGTAAGKRFAEGIGNAAVRSFKQPVMTAIGVLSQAGDRITAKWSQVFTATGGMLVPLVQKVVTAGERISDSLAGAAMKSGPALDALGDSLILVADGASNLIDTLADGSTEAADNLRLLAGGIADVITQTGNFLGVLNKLSSNPWLTGPLLPLLREHYKDVADASGGMKTATDELAESMVDAANAAGGERKAMADLAAEQKAATDPAFALLNAQDKVRESQQNLNSAIKDHGKKSKEARAATRELALAALDLQGKAGALGSTFNGKLTPAMKNTLRSAGLTDKQIEAVGAEFKRAKAAGDKFARNYAARATLTTVYKTIRSTNNENSPGVGSAIRERASGGPIARGIPYLVGEEGPELIVPEAAGRVLSAAATRGNMRTGGGGAVAGGGGGWPASLKVQVELVGPEESRVWFRKMIRTMNVLPEAAA